MKRPCYIDKIKGNDTQPKECVTTDAERYGVKEICIEIDAGHTWETCIYGKLYKEKK